MISNPGLEALFDNASIGIVVINDKGEILAINKFLLAQFGYDKEELTGKHIELLLPERFRNLHTHHRSGFFIEPLNRPMGIGMDLYGLTKSGREFPVEVSLTHYSVEGSDFAAAYISDISLRKSSESALRELNTKLDEKIQERTAALNETIGSLAEQIKQVEAKDLELQKVNSYLESVLNYAGALIIATDQNGLIELFNEAAEQHLGYSAMEVVGKATPLLFHDLQEVQARSTKLSEEFNIPVRAGFDTFTLKAKENTQNPEEWTYVHKSGKRFPVDLTITALRNAENEITGYLGIASDISRRKKAEAELKSALQKEREVNELKSRFVSIASHEFRTPLSTIHSSAYLISQYTTTEENQKRNKHIDRIISSANMLNDILNDFLSVGKIEEGKIQVREKEINILEYFPLVLSELQGLRKPRQQIRYVHSGKETVSTDPGILKHIVYNLLSNALKYSPDAADVHVKTEAQQHAFVLSIKDQGIGIPEEDQKFLFDLFYRASNVGNIHGTGLGLHIIKRYTEILDGDITCVSNINEGTEFKLTFKQSIS